MAFDNASRNRLQNLVSEVRTILTDDFVLQLQQSYGMDPHSGVVTDISVLSHLDDTRLETARILREVMNHYAPNESSSGEATRKKVIERIAREQAFTVLNRLSALKMMESREILVESVSKGIQSEGFRMYHRVAGNSLGDTNETYRCFLFSIFDHFTAELPVLFDRNSPQSSLFPGDQTLARVLEKINQPELESFWSEDETIGWIYQYFNSAEERKKMRDESSAPRNSRELAVRNQFFTPRYVVEFLTDNTLGRIWYEMNKGQTCLVEHCRYLVRQPNEIFLKKDEVAPEEEDQEGLSQEELLKQPFYIPHRPLKDPREIRMLDPACGSMHFGLYCYDLFELIYEEAWDKEIPAPSEKDSSGTKLKPLHETYSSKEEYLEDVPRLILEFNLHGVDIDSRAVQIAGLSMWLRAQRSWQTQGLKKDQRPKITRSNIISAEPMPGEVNFLHEFINKYLSANSEQVLIGKLLTKVFESMKLAGEAGTLLKIEEIISDSISEAKEQWLDGPKYKQGLLFKGDFETAEQLELKLDVSGITDETFWIKAEERIYNSLKTYSESVEVSYQRRLFTDDTVRGFAFIDTCRKRYDVVLMNPPFGEASKEVLSLCDRKYPVWNRNILCAFIENNLLALEDKGLVGSVIDRSFLNKSTYENFREKCLLQKDLLNYILDLGWEVLDANVEVSAVILGSSGHGNITSTHCVDIRDIPTAEKEVELLKIGTRNFTNDERVYQHFTRTFKSFPNQAIVYDLPDQLLSAFSKFQNLKEQHLISFTGHQLESFRHFMLFWEIPLDANISPNEDYCHLYNGGEYSRFAYLPQDVVRFGYFAELRPQDVPSYTYVLRNKEQHFLPGVSFGVRGELLDAHLLPPNHIFTVEGQSLPVADLKTAFLLLAFLNSTVASRLLNSFSGQHKYSGYLNLLPFPNPDASIEDELAKASEKAIRIKREGFTACENSIVFQVPIWIGKVKSSISQDTILLFSLLEQKETELQKLFEYTNLLCSSLFGINAPQDVADLNAYFDNFPKAKLPDFNGASPPEFNTSVCKSITSYSLGLALGRWDIRYAIGESQLPELPDPFEPLPACPPGMLQNTNGLPAAPVDLPENYHLRITWPGILVDDPGHPEDILARVRDALEVIWKDRAENIEQEACEILGVGSLRDYFRRPAGFFADHLKRYSKSRRKAPIYWPLSTYSQNYTLWFYYHRLTDQTLYLAINDFVEPKIEENRRTIKSLQGKSDLNHEDRQQLEKAQDLETELQEFLQELIRLAPAWKPNLNDGVQITAAPLWKLFQHKPWQKVLKETWGKLEKGDYDWAHLAYSYWPDRVEEKCRTDKSLAIAHGLEDIYEN